MNAAGKKENFDASSSAFCGDDPYLSSHYLCSPLASEPG
jgi:hypothetical protein